ncbi:iron ABC transporter permease [Streptococcus iniae]|uniref:Ferrichrome ABC transporter permease n=1 Tax=Streptococcus iniae TaxID=1346 RepID=I6LL03_STRIN|nr:iron ABC transporter permease [Streptococcus iniae]AGM99315.1 putative iron(3+)-hydroxamate import system permease protein FhuB [Streptococcus iniae SF1]ADG63117.1 FtsC [Streptococcus iniae]AHY16250.1 ferrichrome ABC transporter permease [Streptococcus iniae]AHY18114.1 ferrichrome ABC transporter permease [Streptococcus iniae]AJG26402.1 ferrichrome ABC transporter permease [Streptococcus iniae]
MIESKPSQVIHHKPKSFWLLFVIISLLLLSGVYLGLRFGAWNFSHQDLLKVIRHQAIDHRQSSIFWEMRLPRLLATLLVGAALAVSGAIMQAVTRNPIADPGLLGINAGAGLALVVAYAIFHHLHYISIILVCLLGASLACLLVFGLSYQYAKGYQQLRLVLSGAMISMFLSAIGQGITTYFNLATSVIGWQAGGFIGLNWTMLKIIAPLIIFALALAQLLSYQLSILSLSELRAKALGQKTFHLTLVFLSIVLILASASVAIAGSISFVGLVVPHIIKAQSFGNYKQSLPLIGLLGATFMVWVDFFCRNLNPPYETPLTALVSLIGLPAFLWLIKKGGAMK